MVELINKELLDQFVTENTDFLTTLSDDESLVAGVEEWGVNLEDLLQWVEEMASAAIEVEVRMAVANGPPDLNRIVFQSLMIGIEMGRRIALENHARLLEEANRKE